MHEGFSFYRPNAPERGEEPRAPGEPALLFTGLRRPAGCQTAARNLGTVGRQGRELRWTRREPALPPVKKSQRRREEREEKLTLRDVR